MTKRKSLILIIIILTVTAAVVAAALFLGSKLGSESEDEITDELTDEFSRARYFISDWYSELNSTDKCQVYLNELRFTSGKYTLTYASGRIRAVYPRGERFFKLDKITKIEFFETNGILRCRFYYGRNGEYIVRIN